MSIFIKLFLTILLSFSILFTFFINHILDSNEENSLNRLKNKISYNEHIYSDITSQLLFDFNQKIIVSTLGSLYLDKDIISINLIDYSNTINLKLNSKNKSKKELIKSTIPLIVNEDKIGVLEILYTNELIRAENNLYKTEIIQFSLFLVFLLIIIISYFVHILTKDIKKLQTATSEITKGNLDYNINIKSKDEVGDLAKRFEIMKNYLKDKIEQIEEQVKFQQLLIDGINIPIYIKNKNLEFTTCNKSFVEYLGLKKKNILGKRITQIQNNQLSKEYEEFDRETFFNKKSKDFYTKGYNTKGELRDIIAHKNVFLNSQSQVTGVIGSIFDITELNLAKEKIETFNLRLQEKVNKRTIDLKLSNEELEDSNEELQTTIHNLKQTQDKLIESEKMASLGGLVAGIAHEINTPVGIGLTGITHFEEMTSNILNKYKKEEMSQEEFEEYLETSKELSFLIHKNLEKAADLVRSFKQVAVDQSSEEKRFFHIKKYLYEILASIHSVTKKTNIKINISCDEKLSINSYPGAFSQVITNLIMNSIIHGFKNNEEGNISITISKEDKDIKISYKDDGCGIKKENLSKIFDPFFTTNRANGGSGLGLNIIYTIIKSQLKGEISCLSSLNKGVEFIIIFRES